MPQSLGWFVTQWQITKTLVYHLGHRLERELQEAVTLSVFTAMYLWWLILCVNLAGPQGAQIFGQTLFWVFQGGRFLVRLTFKLVDVEYSKLFFRIEWVSSNQLKAWTEQKDQPPLSKTILQQTAFRLHL